MPVSHRTPTPHIAASMAVLAISGPQLAEASEPPPSGPAVASTSEPHDCRDAEDPGICVDRCIYGGEHKEHTANLMGTKGLALTTITPARDGEGPSAVPHFGASLFYERELVTGWLELEFNVALVSAPGGLAIPIDVLLKKPFHVNRHVTPYIGLGPAFEIEVLEEPEFFGGVTAATGLYVWFSRTVGIDVELDYTARFGREGVAHGMGGGMGPVIHF